VEVTVQCVPGMFGVGNIDINDATTFDRSASYPRTNNPVPKFDM
jgi:hypothetical protein